MTKYSQSLVVIGAAIMAFVPVVQRTVLLPVYLNTSHQQILALVNRVSAILLLPGKTLIYMVSPPAAHYFTTSGLIAASVINFVIFWMLGTFFRVLLSRKSTPLLNTLKVSTVESPVSPARRDFLKNSAAGSLGVFAIAAGAFPVLVQPGWLTVRRISIRLPNLPPSLVGLTIAQLTDIHHDEWISIEHVRSAVQLTNSLRPDIVALTGDFVTSKPELIGPVMAEMSRLAPRLGTVGVMGNHDWWTDAALTSKQAAKAGIALLDNDRIFITPDRKLRRTNEGGICLAGVGDLWEDVVDAEKALWGIDQAMPRILLSHNPDVAEQGAVGSGSQRVDLMLSGHTHGGQVRLPLIGAPVVPSAYGQKYAQGLVQGPACLVHISAGLGMGVLPVRLGVPPEVVLITLASA